MITLRHMDMSVVSPLLFQSMVVATTDHSKVRYMMVYANSATKFA